jgi:hypothetical protein
VAQISNRQQSNCGLPDMFCITPEPIALAPAKDAVMDARSNWRWATIRTERQQRRKLGEAPEASDSQSRETLSAAWLKSW